MSTEEQTATLMSQPAQQMTFPQPYQPAQAPDSGSNAGLMVGVFVVIVVIVILVWFMTSKKDDTSGTLAPNSDSLFIGAGPITSTPAISSGVTAASGTFTPTTATTTGSWLLTQVAGTAANSGGPTYDMTLSFQLVYAWTFAVATPLPSPQTYTMVLNLTLGELSAAIKELGSETFSTFTAGTNVGTAFSQMFGSCGVSTYVGGTSKSNGLTITATGTQPAGTPTKGTDIIMVTAIIPVTVASSTS